MSALPSSIRTYLLYSVSVTELALQGYVVRTFIRADRGKL